MLVSFNKAEPTIEEKLVIQAAKGDFAAFEELVNLYKQPLWKFAYRLLGNYDDANDAIQQILLQLYHSLPTLEDPSRYRTWLFKIARHKCLDQLRRKSSTPPTFSDISGQGEEKGGDAPLDLFPDPDPLPDEVVERRETQQLLREAIAALPERNRQVVVFRYTTDLSFSEIGEVLGLNENTVKTLFQRAKGQLRLFLRQRL